LDVDLLFADQALQHIAESQVSCDSRYGRADALLVRQRLCELMASENLAIAAQVPTLEVGPLAGRPREFAVRVRSKLRIVFECASDGIDDSDMQKVATIRILAIEACDEP
jgi:hypothetical protein